MIYNENNNNWIVALNYTDAHGRRHHLTKRGFKSEADAKKFEETFLHGIKHDAAKDNDGEC